MKNAKVKIGRLDREVRIFILHFTFYILHFTFSPIAATLLGCLPQNQATL